MADEVAGEEPGVTGKEDAPEQGDAAPTTVEASVQQDILAAMRQADGGEAADGEAEAAPEADSAGDE